MWQALAILASAVFTVAVAVAAGTLALRRLRLTLYRGEAMLLAFILGSACLSLLVFLLAAAGVAYAAVFLSCGAAVVAACLWTERGRGRRDPLPDYPAFWKAVFVAGFSVFAVLYLLHALAPEFSPDGAGRRLALVAGYAREHGSPHATPGLEMLYLVAFVLGRHSAAALVHFAFLLALPLLMLSYARRMGLAKAGVFGALFTFASPLAGVDGSSATVDVALAATLFAVFYLFEIQDRARRAAHLIPIGLLAGWAAVVASTGREWRTYETIQSWLEIPLEAAILGGTLGGVAGPLFLLAPVALVALRGREGRRLLLAGAALGALYPLDIGARNLIPCMPFVSLAMGLAFANTRILAPALIAAHLFLSYPNVVATYCDPAAWRIKTTSLGAALRLRPEGGFLAARLPAYAMTARLDRLVPPGGRVFALHPIPEAYTSREVLTPTRGGQGRKLMDAMRAAVEPDRRPTLRRSFRIPSQRLRAIRVVATAAAKGEWIIHELRLFHQGRELPRAPAWRLRADPNPRDVQLAFDNSPVTFWNSGVDLRPGMKLEIDFGEPAELDTLLLVSSPGQSRARLKLQVTPETGAWQDASDRTDDREVPRPAGLRRFAMREFQAHGVGYILAADSGPLARDVLEKPALWGLGEIARERDQRLFQVR